MNKKICNIIFDIFLALLFTILIACIFEGKYSIDSEGSNLSAQAKVTGWNHVDDKDARVYKLSYGVGRFRYSESLAVSNVYVEGDSVKYEVIDDGVITIKNGVAEWLHDDDSIEIISNAVIMRDK